METSPLDFAGPFQDKMFLVVVDAFSKWPEVIVMSSTTASHAVDVILTIFARNGIPERIVTDNGPQFTSSVFMQFMRNNSTFLDSTIPPSNQWTCWAFCPDTQIRPEIYAGGREYPRESRKVPYCISHLPPHKDWGNSIKTLPGTRNSHPPVTYQDKCSRQGTDRWTTGLVLRRYGPLSYEVKVGDKIWRRHIEQLKPGACERQNAREENRRPTSNYSVAPEPMVADRPHQPEAEVTPPSELHTTPENVHAPNTAVPDLGNGNAQVAKTPRPQRKRRPPERLIVGLD
ncbi:uncharacterized protein LOC135369387 [Ornithodoros turicata]|uniref:uncharacterized protein LOC135369387 n=1 Tax=Ornithodoros turicata TaxID=34597 RepID=UPI00313A0B55